MVETAVAARKTRVAPSFQKPQSLSEVKLQKTSRMQTTIKEFDRVCGGGIADGSVILITGEPGIGKSTLMLQLIAKTGGLYVSGEESPHQVKMRAQRLCVSDGESQNKILFSPETNVENISSFISTQKPKLVIVDSVQTVWTDNLSQAPGSVSQIREASFQLIKTAKETNIPIFLVGHITKSGAIAGPKILEHMVDTVLYLEGERFNSARLLRSIKNRFGPTDEVGVFEMKDKGLVEVTNPSGLFLRERVKNIPGSIVVATMEGTRPVLVEIQSLVSKSSLMIAKRVAQGVDSRRLQLISAILSKHSKLSLQDYDIYVNVAGGLKIQEPAADLGIVLAIASSFLGKTLDEKLTAFGEVGLLGEVREVSNSEKRIKEAKGLGFAQIASPKDFKFVNQAISKFLK